MKYAYLLIVIIGISLSWTTSAQVPQLINYQGRVTVNGTNFSGAAQFKFALVNAAGSSNYWSNDGTVTGQPVAVVPITVTNGLYSVSLGDTALAGMIVPVAATVFANSNVWLRVWFNDTTTGFQQLVPDQRIAAVGYAFVAASVDPTIDLRAQRLNIGTGNYLSGANAAIAGGIANTVTNNYTFIGGGLTNAAYGLGSAVGGGELNLASGTLAFVGGGYDNSAGNVEAVVAGGGLNAASGTNSFIGGGYGNLATNTEATISGGEYNGAYGVISTIGGGFGNLASGYAATIPGGYGNVASGAYSFASGAGAAATNFGAFVWADASTTNIFYSTNSNEFCVRSSGGVRIYANAALSLGVRLAPGGNTWSSTSDRNVKENFKPVDGRAVLARLVATPVTEWNLISQDPAIRHIGPMAQDFKAAFGVGEDDHHISTTDADGVAFAAIQGLNQLVQEKDAQINQLEKSMRALEQRLKLVEQIQQAARLSQAGDQ